MIVSNLFLYCFVILFLARLKRTSAFIRGTRNGVKDKPDRTDASASEQNKKNETSLTKAFTTWTEYEPSCYTMILTKTCRCVGFFDPLIVRVENNVVVDFYTLYQYFAPVEIPDNWAPTMTEIFEQAKSDCTDIERKTARGRGSACVIEYAPEEAGSYITTGSAYIDPSTLQTDEEVSYHYQVRNLTSCKL